MVLKPGAETTAEALIAHCRTLIAGFKIPKTISFVPHLPISPAGKILKQLLRGDEAASAFAPGAADDAVL